MPLFYERKETKNEIVIKYKSAIVYYLFLGIIIPLLWADLIFGIETVRPFSGLIIIWLIVVYLGFSKPTNEVKNFLNKGTHIKTSGNKLSISNPYIVVIKKKK